MKTFVIDGRILQVTYQTETRLKLKIKDIIASSEIFIIEVELSSDWVKSTICDALVSQSHIELRGWIRDDDISQAHYIGDVIQHDTL